MSCMLVCYGMEMFNAVALLVFFPTAITLDLILQAHVEYETVKRHYAHVDCPGHADYVKVSR